MNRDDIIRMAREAYGDWYPNAVPPALERFAALVAAEKDKQIYAICELALRTGVITEREACARVCDEVETQGHALWKRTYDSDAQGRSTGAADCAAAIRARGEK